MIWYNQYSWSIDSLNLNLQLLSNTFIKRFHENLSDLELRLATSLMEAKLVKERHFTFPEYFIPSDAKLIDVINTIATI
jgi:hypothetical protein